MPLYILSDRDSGSHEGVFPQASAASGVGERLRLNSIPASSLELQFKAGVGEGARTESYEWENSNSNTNTTQGRGVLFLLCIISFILTLLCMSQKFCMGRGQQLQEGSPAQAAHGPAFCPPLQLRSSAPPPSWPFIWLNLCSWSPVHRKQSFFLFVWCSGELEACSLSGPHVCLPLSTRQWVLKNWSFQVTFL